MNWNLNNCPDSIKNKPLEQKQLFVKVANEAILKGRNTEESLFAGLSAIKAKFKVAKTVDKPSPVPSHILAVTKKVEDAPVIKEEFLPKNKINPDSERSLISALWDTKGRLILLFDDGKKIITEPVPVSEYIEQHFSITTNNQDQVSVEGDTEVQAKRTDIVDDFTMYQAEAVAGVLNSSTGWRIKLISVSLDGDMSITWANGNANYDKVWDDRLTYTYS